LSVLLLDTNGDIGESIVSLRECLLGNFTAPLLNHKVSKYGSPFIFFFLLIFVEHRKRSTEKKRREKHKGGGGREKENKPEIYFKNREKFTKN
jgi:hypothetical protein